MSGEVGVPVVARHPGRCGICDEPFVPYEDVIALLDGEWCHDECIESEAGDA